MQHLGYIIESFCSKRELKRLDLCFSLHHHPFTMLEEGLLDSTGSGATPTSPASQTSLDDRATDYSHTSRSPGKNVRTKCAVGPTCNSLGGSSTVFQQNY